MVKSNSVFFVLLMFVATVFVTALVVLKEVWFPINGGEYNFKNFLIYNFAVKIIGYVLKFLIVYLFFKFVFLIFDLKKDIALFKILLLAETIYILLIKGSLLIYYYFIDSNIDKDFVNTYESNTSLVAFMPKGYYEFNYVIGFANVFDLIYVSFIVFMIAEELKISFWKSFKINGLSYLVLLLLLGVIKTFMSL